MSRENQFKPVADNVAAAQMAIFILGCLAYPHELLVRRFGTIGRGYRHRLQSGVGILLVPILYVVVIPPKGGMGWVYLHWGAMVVLGAVHNMAPKRRPFIHSQYIGDPRIGRGEGRWWETILGMAIGLALEKLCPTIAVCQIVGTVCSRMQLLSIEARERRMLEAMRDAQWEAEVYAEMMRRGK